MCFNNKPIQSGTKQIAGAYTPERGELGALGKMGGMRAKGGGPLRMGIPLMQDASRPYDTTGAASAAEAWTNADAKIASAQVRPMTEAEWTAFQRGRLAIRPQQMRQGMRQGIIPSQPSTYEEYSRRAAGATPVTSRTIGGGSRATGLGI